MEDKSKSFMTAIKTVRVDIGNGFEEFECVSTVGVENALLLIGNDKTIGAYKMEDSKLYIMASSGEYEIKDWYFTRTYDLKEMLMTQEPGSKLNILPTHSDDFVRVIDAFKHIHKFGKWKLQIKNMPINDEGFKGLIREILRDRVKPQYPNYNERYESKLINIMFQESINALGESSADKYEEYYLHYIKSLNELLETNFDEVKPMVERKPGIVTKVMNMFK